MTHRVHELCCPPKVAIDLKADDATEACHLLHRDVVVRVTLQAYYQTRMTTLSINAHGTAGCMKGNGLCAMQDTSAL